MGSLLNMSVAKIIAEEFGGNIQQGDLYYKRNNKGEWVGKPYIQRTDLSVDWVENVKQEDIDTRYFNLDGTRK